jgi:hypothetical protein
MHFVYAITDWPKSLMPTSNTNPLALSSLDVLGAGEPYRYKIASLLESSGYLFR